MPKGIVPPELLIGTETSDDAAVYRFNEKQALVATTDFFMPIVDDPFDFGRIAATNALSDVYAMGGQPIMALAIVGMPIDKLSTEVIGKILEGGASVCKDADIPVAGGHSIDSVEPIYGLVAMGIVDPKLARANAQAQAGDILILGKPLGIGVLSSALKKDLLDAEAYAEMIRVTTQLNSIGAKLAQNAKVHAMTDVTGFALLGHCLEICRGSNVRAELRFNELPVIEQAATFARQNIKTGASARNWDSYGTEVELRDLDEWKKIILTDPQTSGGLLVSVAPDAKEEILRMFHENGYDRASVIGKVEKYQGGARAVVS
jgi:selenide,water dikinase